MVLRVWAGEAPFAKMQTPAWTILRTKFCTLLRRFVSLSLRCPCRSSSYLPSSPTLKSLGYYCFRYDDSKAKCWLPCDAKLRRRSRSARSALTGRGVRIARIVAEKAESTVKCRCRTTQHDLHIISLMPGVSRSGNSNSNIEELVAGLTISVNTAMSAMSIMSSTTHPGLSINQFES